MSVSLFGTTFRGRGPESPATPDRSTFPRPRATRITGNGLALVSPVLRQAPSPRSGAGRGAAVTTTARMAANWSLASSWAGIPLIHTTTLEVPSPGGLPSARIVAELDVAGRIMGRAVIVEGGLPPGRSTIGPTHIALDPDRMATITHRTQGRVSFIDEATCSAAASVAVSVLPHDHWAASPEAPHTATTNTNTVPPLVSGLGARLLAQHVCPTDPAVARISFHLSTRGRDPLPRKSGHGDDVDRAVEVALRAVAAAGIAMDPGPLRDDTGLRIVAPSSVIAARQGTVSDLAALIAALLERLDLSPVLLVLTESLLVGYWRRGHRQLPWGITRDPQRIAALVAEGSLAVIHPSSLTGDSTRIAPSLAAGRHAALFATSRDSLHALIDINAARLTGVRPLPAPATR